MIITNRSGSPTMQSVLVPAAQAASAIWISTAYISPNACETLGLRHRAQHAPVHIVVGRAQEEGLAKSTLDYLHALDAIAALTGGGVRAAAPASHAKLYAFESSVGPTQSWIGSSNLTGHGLQHWAEANFQVDHPSLLAEVQHAWHSAAPLSSVPLARPPIRRAGSPDIVLASADVIPEEPGSIATATSRVCLHLHGKNGQVQAAAGLNWSFGAGRPRDKNEAYIALPAAMVPHVAAIFGGNTVGTVFHVILHDGTQMPMRLEGATEAGSTVPKQITSLGEKKIFGKWILRDMLGQPIGSRVTRHDLDIYGRTSICFSRLGTDPATGRAIVFGDFKP